MIVVRVELWSAITGKVTELARMTIANDGTGSDTKRNYDVATMVGRTRDDLQRAMVNRRHTRTGRIEGHNSPAVHVWNLVGKALTAMGYGR